MPASTFERVTDLASDAAWLSVALSEKLAAIPEPDLEELLEEWNCPSPKGKFEVRDGIIIDGEARHCRFTSVALGSACADQAASAMFTLRDSAELPNSFFPYRALLSCEANDAAGWRLDCIESMCPSCVGMGVLEPGFRPCDTCGGSGWGSPESAVTRINAS